MLGRFIAEPTRGIGHELLSVIIRYALITLSTLDPASFVNIPAAFNPYRKQSSLLPTLSGKKNAQRGAGYFYC